MPPGRIPPHPDHPLIAHVDSSFTNAKYMVAWLRKLYPGGYDPYADRNIPNVSFWGLKAEDHVFQMDVLSGQDVALMEATHYVLEAARYRNSENKADDRISQFVFNDLNADLERAQNTWKGAVADSVHEYRKDFQNFYPEHQKAIGLLGNCMVAYAGAISEARKDINEIAGQFYDSLENNYYSSGFSLEYVIAVLDVVVGFVLDKLPLKPDEERIFGAILGKATSTLGSSIGGQEINGDEMQDIAKAHVKAANDVCDKAKAQIQAITARLHSDVDEALTNMGPVPVPKLAGTVSDGFDVDLSVLQSLITTTDSSIAYFSVNAQVLRAGANGLASGYPLLGGQGESGDFFNAGKEFSTKFTQLYNRIADTYDAFIAGLTLLRQGLQAAYDAYTHTESRVTQSFGVLRDKFSAGKF
jgi:uncharacterized protein YukE